MATVRIFDATFFEKNEHRNAYSVTDCKFSSLVLLGNAKMDMICVFSFYFVNFYCAQTEPMIQQ
jgi:hypothetical protein